MSVEKIIGDFENTSLKKELFAVKMIFCVDDFKLDWRRCNLVANYIAEYASYNFEQKDKAENLISTVTNEIVEFVSSFSYPKTKMGIQFKIFDDSILFEFTNSILKEELDNYKNVIEKINNNNINDLYIKLIEDDFKLDKHKFDFSFVMLAHDYNAKFSSKIKLDESSSVMRVLVKKEEITK